mmetsp:Transcript_20968/g.31027  ORF Transcript_20968/g.31027 Transcript_20968/m.31027 type:complete len:202 (+) Transcript_20968:374-979(+)
MQAGTTSELSFQSSSNKALLTTTFAISPLMWVSLGTSAVQSPTENTFGLDMDLALSSTRIPRFASYSTPAASRFRFSTLGARPVATNRHSASSVTSFPSESIERRMSGKSSSSSLSLKVSTFVIFAIFKNSMLQLSSRVFCKYGPASTSPLGKSELLRTSTVTLEPNVANTCAISRATTPDPRMTIRGGRCVRLNNVSFVV